MWYRHKVVRVGAWGQLGMRMGALGLLSKGERITTQKKYTNRRVGQYFVAHDNCKKIRLTLGVQKNTTERIISINLGG